MGFVDKLSPDWREVPGEPDALIAFRPVSGEELEEAQTRNLERSMRMEISDGMAGAMMKPRVCPQCGWKGQEKQGGEGVLALTDCDKKTLVRYGIVDWKGGSYEGVDCTDERKAKLAGAAFTWAAKQIFELSYITVGEASGSETSGMNGASPDENSEPSSTPSLTPVATSDQS